MEGSIFYNFGRFKRFDFEKEGFYKTHPKSWESFLHISVPISCVLISPYSMGLRYHKHFRGSLRVTNDSFQIHMQYSITFYYDICQMNNYINVTGPNLYDFGRFGICNFV